MCVAMKNSRHLSDIANISLGRQLNRSTLSSTGSYPVYNGGMTASGYTDKFNTDANQIIVSQGGESAGFVNYITAPFWAGAHCYVVQPATDKIDKRYLYFYLKSMQRYLQESRTGSSIPGLSKSKLSQFPVQVPSIAEQKTASGILTNIENAISLNDDLLKMCSKVAEMLYDYWFVQFNFPDENGRPYKSSGGKMVYNEQLKQEIPEGWKCKKLIDLFDFMRGTEVGSDAYADKKISDDYIRFWRVRDVGNDCKTWIDGNARNLTVVKPGDVVITLDGTVGKIGIDLDGAISGGLRHVVDHTNTISNATICAILQSDYVQESLRQYVSGRGSILAHASGALQHLAIPYDKNIFNKFQNIIQPMFDLMINSKEQSKQLASLRDWLLPMLMNGQVEIRERKEVSNDQV